MKGDFTRPRDVYAFLRVKQECISRNSATRQHDLISITADGLMLIKCSEEVYNINRNWLLKYPLLSCYTEIQRIKPKCKN